MDLEYLEDITETTFGNQKPPFLPDVHLKSAITEDFIKSIKRHLENPILVHPDKYIQDDIDNLRKIVTERNRKGSIGESQDKILLAGQEVVKFYPQIWGRRSNKDLKPSLIQKVNSHWKIFQRYWTYTKETMKRILGSLLRIDVPPESFHRQFENSLDDKFGLASSSIKSTYKDKLIILSQELSQNHLLNYSIILEKLDSLLINHNDVHDYFITMDRLNRLRSLLVKTQVNRENKFKEFNLYHPRDVIYNNNICAYYVDDKTILLLTIDQILMLSDVASSRALSILTASLYNSLNYNLLPQVITINHVYHWMDQVLINLGNEGYNILKKVESLCLGHYLSRFDPLHYSSKLLDNLRDESTVTENEHINKFLQILEENTHPNQIFEIYGLYRHGGHPVVDEVKGCEKMREIAREKVQVDQEIILQTLGSCKKDFLIQYLCLNKQWPLINYPMTEAIINRYINSGDKYLVISPQYCAYNPDRAQKLDTIESNLLENLTTSETLEEKIDNHLKHLRKKKFKPEPISEENKLILLDFLQMLKSKPKSINEYECSVPIEYWAFIIFSKNFEYNDYEDFTNLLGDTAISPKRSNWTSLYKRSLLTESLPPDKEYSRRTLLNLLKRPDFSMKKIREIISGGKVPFDWKIIAIHSKERELKIASRLFAMMVLEMRMYFAGSEKNISDSYFKYVPTQTMTNSEAELTQKLLSMTNNQGSTNYLPVMMSCDIDKFNMRWRALIVDAFFKHLDEVYGLSNFYTYSHVFFESSFICLASNFHPPCYLKKNSISRVTGKEVGKRKGNKRKLTKNLEKKSRTTWRGQGGGFEGLRQKGWTLIMAAILKLVERRTGIKSYIIGQGDNQFIVMMIQLLSNVMSVDDFLQNYQDYINEIIENYIRELTRCMGGLGMVLKTEETWVSSTLLCYGKEILINGCYSTSILKRAARAYSDVNEVYPTLSTRISSIYSACHSIASKSFEPILPYSLAILLSSYMIDLELKNQGISRFKNTILGPNIIQRISKIEDPILSLEEFIIFYLLNKEVGGYPILPITEFLYRGHPDPINSYFCLLNKDSIYPEVRKIIVYISKYYKKHKNTDDNFKKLIQDPTCLNWTSYTMDTGILSNMLEENLSKNVVNKDIKILLDSTDKEATTQLIDYLSSTVPFIPRVLNEIFRHTPEGAKLAYLSTFCDMKTMKEMMVPSDSNRLIVILEDQESILFKEVLNIIRKVIGLNPDDPCLSDWENSFLMSEKITDYQWGVKVVGSRIPHPSQQCVLVPLNDGDCCICNSKLPFFTEHINYVINQKDLEDHEIKSHDPELLKLYFYRGKFVPYIGSTTREKRSRSLINFKKGDKALVAAQSLQRINDWIVNPDSDLNQFIEAVIKSRTDLPIPTIKLASGRWYGGSVVHRFQDVITKHSCRPNSRPNLFSHIYITSDSMGDFSGGQDNTNIHFQSCYLYGFALINLKTFWAQRVVLESSHLHFINYDSVQLTDTPQLTNPKSPPKLVPLKNCRLLYSTIDEYVDKRVEFQFDDSNIISPEICKNKIHKLAHNSAASIVYANYLEQIIPLLQLTESIQVNDITACPLTIDDLEKLNLKDLMIEVGKIWYYDNIRAIHQASVDQRLPVERLIHYLISQYPPAALPAFRSIFNHESIRNKIIENFGWPVSSNFIKSAVTIDKLFVETITEGALIAYYSNKPLRYLFPHKNFKVNRWLNMYFNSLLNIEFSQSSYTLLKYIDLMSEELYKLLGKNQNHIKNCLRSYLDLAKRDSRLNTIAINAPLISGCGSEPWVRYYKDQLKLSTEESSVSLTTPSLITLKSKFSCVMMKSERIKRDLTKFVNLLKPRIEKEFEVSSIQNQEGSCINRLRVINNLTDIKLRITHQDRLVGLYSTAMYKYLEILLNYLDRSFNLAVCLAEGAGGVARLVAEIFGVKYIIYNSLLDLSEFIAQKATSYIPPELIGSYWHKEHRILGIETCLRTGGDLRKESVVKDYLKLIKKNKNSPSIFTFDAELGSQFEPEDIKRLLKNVAVLVSELGIGSVAILKTFYYYIDMFETILYSLITKFFKVKMIKPQMSSKENTEIFLVIEIIQSPIEREFSVDTKLNSQITLLHSVSLMYQDGMNLPLELKTDLHETLHSIGFSYNLKHALTTITNGIINYNNFIEEPLKEICFYLDLTIANIKKRFELMGRSLKNQRLSDLELAVRRKRLKESAELQSLSETTMNLLLLRRMLINGDLDMNLLTEPLDILYRTDSGEKFAIYTIKIDLDNWRGLYLRGFQKIKGYLNTPNMWKLGLSE